MVYHVIPWYIFIRVAARFQLAKVLDDIAFGTYVQILSKLLTCDESLNNKLFKSHVMTFHIFSQNV